jgi:hypothetical protein
MNAHYVGLKFKKLRDLALAQSPVGQEGASRRG